MTGKERKTVHALTMVMLEEMAMTKPTAPMTRYEAELFLTELGLTPAEAAGAVAVVVAYPSGTVRSLVELLQAASGEVVLSAKQGAREFC